MTTVADAFIAAVRDAVNPFGTAVFDSVVPKDAPLQHVAVYPASAQIDDPGMCTFDQGIVRVQVTSVAAGPGGMLGIQCRAIAAKVRDHMTGRVLVADDWRCGVIEHDFSNPPQHDEDVVGQPTVYATDGYRFLVVRI